MRNLLLRSAVAALIVSGLATGALAQAGGAAAPAPMAKSVYDQVVNGTTAKLTLTSSDIKAGQTIADDFSQNGANKSPQLTWTAGPAATKSYVVVTQDVTTANPVPVQHWIMFNVPATVTSVPTGVPLGANPTGNLAGAVQATVNNNAGYRGPKPPKDSVHSYVFQVYALDTTLSGIDTTVNAPNLITAMMGHVLAAGELIAPYTGK